MSHLWTDATCAACGRSIRVWDASGPRWGRPLRVLVDPDPTDDGDTIIQAEGIPVGAIREDVVGRFLLYRSHFFSCPNHLVVPEEPASITFRDGAAGVIS